MLVKSPGLSVLVQSFVLLALRNKILLCYRPHYVASLHDINTVEGLYYSGNLDQD